MAKDLISQKQSRAEAKGLTLLAVTLILLLSLLSFRLHNVPHNWLGLVGHGMGLAMHYLFGFTSFFAVGFLGWLGYKWATSGEVPRLLWKCLYASLFMLSCGVLLNLGAERGLKLPAAWQNSTYIQSTLLYQPLPHRHVRHNLGGVPLYYVYKDLPVCNLQHLFSDVGVGLTFSITALLSLMFLTEMPLLKLLQLLRRSVQPLTQWDTRTKESAPSPQEKKSDPIVSSPPIVQPTRGVISPPKERSTPPKPYQGSYTSYVLPPASLLHNPKKVDHPSLKKQLRGQAEILEETLLSFGIEAKVGEIYCGPTITSFEVHPAVGVKVQKIKALENDIALNLQAKSIRIIAPIPGKAAVGIEIPSLYPQEVSFKELLLSYQGGSRKFQIPVLLGKTVAGDLVMSDLTKMPHCIIAGATGSGKSVCINTLVMSILLNARPDEIRLILIDPKKVELTQYAMLPHMIAPVITEPHGAYAALSWLVKEMQLRYEILKQLGLRHITAFNHRQVNKELEASLSIPVPERMPLIVAIIDEFADLMLASSSDLETPIARIAQMARAVGIHLVLATQRPSREVITGLIKANFPTRVAFKVSSRVNSQIILDENGAESLLGNGDMLFLPPATSQLLRAQGAFISDEEIHRIISYICDQAPTNYLIASFDHMRKEELLASGEADGSKDDLYEQALAIVLDTRTASTTFLQRKLKIGYARAASLMDELEANGVIGSQEGSRPRRVLAPSKYPQSQDKEGAEGDAWS